MSSAYRILPHYTYDDWVQWEGKWELIEGIPFAMSPAAVPKHQQISAELISEFIFSLRKVKCKTCRVYSPIDFKISEDIILEPDILIVCDEIKKNYLDFPPVLVIEILSPSTALKDRNTKFQIYQQQKIKYYLIIDVNIESIEVYELINDTYKLHSLNDHELFEFKLHDSCNITPDLKSIWA